MDKLPVIQSAGMAMQVRAEGEAPKGVELSGDFREFTQASRLEELVQLAREVVEDPTLPTVRAWTRDGRKAVMHFPVYTPHEIGHALGMLPVTVHGGGEAVEISHADASLGSFLCSISKTTLEMGMTGKLDGCSAFVFPYICDVSRNLEGIFQRQFPGKATHMLHMPQNFESQATADFLAAEYRRLAGKLERIAGKALEPAALARSIELFNRQRALIGELEALKRREPWKLTLVESYLLRRIGTLLPREVHVKALTTALAQARTRDRKRRDAIPVLVVGPFCEQPTLDLLQLVEEVGCYAVEDELQMLPRWIPRVEPGADPLRKLAEAYVKTPVDIGVRRAPSTKAEAILQRVRSSGAQGVLFLTAKFCEPALEDLVLYRRALERNGVPSLHLEFEEKSSGYEQSRLALETFVESILFD